MIFAVNYLSTTIDLHQKRFFYKLGDFENLCRYISQKSRRYAVQNGRKFYLDGKDVEVFFDELGQLFIKFHMTRNLEKSPFLRQ